MRGITKLAEVFLIILFSVGCTGKQLNAEKGQPQYPAMFQHVSADTPYLFTSLAPYPDEYLERYEKLLPDVENFLDLLIKFTETEEDFREMPNELKFFLAFLKNFQGNLSKEGLSKLGLSYTARSVLYGIGPLPAFRMEILDEQKVQTLIVNAIQESNISLETRKLDSQEYWMYSVKDFHFILALQNNEMVLGVSSKQALQSYLPKLLGKEKPAVSITNSDIIPNLMKKHNFQPMTLGYIDITLLSQMVFGKATGLNQEMMQALEITPPNVSEVCQSEIESMIAKIPRMVFGIEQISSNSVTTSFAFELEEGLRKELSAIKTVAPGIPQTSVPSVVVSLGAQLDIPKTIDFLQTQVKKIQTDPFRCEDFSDLNEIATDFGNSLNTPIPPVLIGVKGVYAALEDLQFDHIAEEVTSLQGYLLLSLTEPETLLGFAQVFVPNIPSLSPGQAITIPEQGEMQKELPFIKNPKLAMLQNGLAVSVGIENPNTLITKRQEEARETTVTDPPIFFMSYDMGTFARWVSEDMQKKAVLFALNNPLKSQIIESYSKLMSILGSSFLSLHFNERGIVFRQVSEFPPDTTLGTLLP